MKGMNEGVSKNFSALHLLRHHLSTLWGSRRPNGTFFFSIPRLDLLIHLLLAYTQYVVTSLICMPLVSTSTVQGDHCGESPAHAQNAQSSVLYRGCLIHFSITLPHLPFNKPQMLALRLSAFILPWLEYMICFLGGRFSQNEGWETLSRSHSRGTNWQLLCVHWAAECPHRNFKVLFLNNLLIF
jgi:hypothetical protein